jgi:hypothetical protein
MNIYEQDRYVQYLARLSHIVILICISGLAISFWFGPHSFTHIALSMLAGLIYTIFMLLYWNHKSNPGAIIFLIISVAVLVNGYIVIYNFTFGAEGKNNIWLGIQYISSALLIFSVVLFILRKKAA